jgi:hypothetical protein
MEKKNREKRVNEYIEYNVAYLNKSYNKHIFPNIHEVLMRIPDKVFNKIEKKCLFLILDGEANACNFDLPSRKYLIILNGREFIICSKKDKNWTIAHEVAHVFRFKRFNPVRAVEEAKVEEIVEQWGFEKSVNHRIDEKLFSFGSKLKNCLKPILNNISSKTKNIISYKLHFRYGFY